MEKLLLIEQDDALYRGPYHNFPTDIWDENKQKWVKYEGDVPKPGFWGNVITPEQAENFKVAL